MVLITRYDVKEHILELNSKQKAALRTLGQRLKPTVVIGKAGLSDSLITNVKAVIARVELLKVRMPAGSAEQRQQMADDLAKACDAAVAGVVGRNALLYRSSEEVAPKNRIVLP
ncbi:MAG: YhbY family RNA-binding protein [Planctomycetaceae bacterium]|nr:MAG: YhbY family RNA-binding protein [Planctomycetaceae bacterium]